MRTCLFTVNVGDFLREPVRRAFLAACQRWACDYAELRHEIVPGYPTCTKLHGARMLGGYGRLAYYDADVVIAPHAPNPFDLCVADNTLYAVRDLQSLTDPGFWREKILDWSMQGTIEQFPWMRRPLEQKFFNSGFWMYRNSTMMQAMFEAALGSLPDKPGPLQEQGTLNAVAHNYPGLKIELLPEIWNHMIAGGDPDPQAYANHYGGQAAKDKLQQLI